MQVEQHQPESAASSCGSVGTDGTTLIERDYPSSCGAVGDRLLVHLTSSKKIQLVMEILRHPHKVLMKGANTNSQRHNFPGQGS